MLAQRGGHTLGAERGAHTCVLRKVGIHGEQRDVHIDGCRERCSYVCAQIG